ncbi:MAG: ATP-binding cassette domain-containing protein [Cytophagaceae bacterium]|jgi:ABC-type multidrug transport system ATPase subunit|nr:ATP-binding cassette domain-containing protein [Cytophagaceae bacterium]
MYQVELSGIGKRFNKQILFKNVHYTFAKGKSYAITGHNGSGKSTFLQVVSGIQLPSQGSIRLLENAQALPEIPYQHCSFAAPYLELVEEFTLNETIEFHLSLKRFFTWVDLNEELRDAGLFAHRNKELRWYSSGMKQRAKLVLALFSDTPLLLLDEPCSNLDEAGIEWYLTKINKIKAERLVLIASNVRQEYSFCDEILSLEHYK